MSEVVEWLKLGRFVAANAMGRMERGWAAFFRIPIRFMKLAGFAERLPGHLPQAAF